MRRQVAAVELHAFDDLHFGLQALALFDRDDAVLADLLHRVRDDLADLGVVVRRDRSDLHDRLLVVAGNDLLHALQLVDDRVGGLPDALDELGVVGAGRQVLHPLFADRLGEQRRGRRAVTGSVRGLAGRFLHELRAHVLVAVLELDLLGDGHTVLRHRRAAPALVEHCVATAGTESGDDGLRQLGDTAQHGFAGVVFEHELFDHHNLGEESGILRWGGSAGHLVEAAPRIPVGATKSLRSAERARRQANVVPAWKRVGSWSRWWCKRGTDTWLRRIPDVPRHRAMAVSRDILTAGPRGSWRRRAILA